MRGGKRCDFGWLRNGHSNDFLFGCGPSGHASGCRCSDQRRGRIRPRLGDEMNGVGRPWYCKTWEAVAARLRFFAGDGGGAGSAGRAACGGHGAFGQTRHRAGCGTTGGVGDFGAGRAAACVVVTTVRGELCGDYGGRDRSPDRGGACRASGGGWENLGGGLVPFHK